MSGGNQRERYRDRPAQEHQNNGAERDKARDAESWRRGRAMAWDDFAQVALRHFMDNSKDDDERQGAPYAAINFADALLAERDRRFGS